MDIYRVLIIVAVCVLLVANVIQFRRFLRDRAAQRQLKKELDSTNASLEEYVCIAPQNQLRLLKLLNYERGTALKIGTYRQVESVTMDVNMPAFSEFSHGKAAADIVESVNALLAGIIPVVQQSGGTIERFNGAGLTALFGNEYERAVTAAISICDEAARRGNGGDAITVGICDGTSLFGVVGHGDTMSVLALTGDTHMAALLRSIGYKYNSRIIVTSRVLERIPEAARRFSCRRLGCIQMQATQTLEWVYDVFDGDLADVRNSKRKTKMVFEKGVSLFSEGEILSARQHFVEVLKTDSRDRAAKEYLLLCDGVLNRQLLTQNYIESV